MEPDLFVPGDQQLTPMGIEPLLPRKEKDLNLGTLAKNVMKNKALDYAAGKLGMDAAQASGLVSILGMGANIFSPLAAASALTGRSLGISEYLANKRAQKAIQKNIQNDPQGSASTYPTGIMQMQPTNQEDRRGGQYNQPSTPSQSYSAPQQTAGPGGLHNYG